MEIFDIVIGTTIDFMNTELFVKIFTPVFIFAFCIYILRLFGNKF